MPSIGKQTAVFMVWVSPGGGNGAGKADTAGRAPRFLGFARGPEASARHRRRASSRPSTANGKRAAKRRPAPHEQCAIVQSVVDDQRPNITLVIIALKTADHKSRLMRVIAPLGVLLPTGLDLKLEQRRVGRMGFVRCLPNGCVAEK